MVWQKIDDQFGISRKVIRIPKRQRLAAVGLWTLAANYSVRSLTDGVLEGHELDELGAPNALVRELIRVELWHGADGVCEKCVAAPIGGAVIHDFLVYNPSRVKVLTEREAERVRKASQRDRGRTHGGTPAGSGAVSEHPSPSPVPNPIDVTDLPESSQVSDATVSRLDAVFTEARRVGISDLEAVRKLLVGATGNEMTLRGALELAKAIASKSARNIRNVDAYVATVCGRSAPEVQQAYFDLDIEGIAS